jgi:hypothetical protein
MVVSEQMDSYAVNLGSTRIKNVGVNDIQEHFVFVVDGKACDCPGVCLQRAIALLLSRFGL